MGLAVYPWQEELARELVSFKDNLPNGRHDRLGHRLRQESILRASAQRRHAVWRV